LKTLKYLFMSLMNFILVFLKDETGAFSFSQVTAITHDLIKDEMTEGVFLSSEFLRKLRDMQELEEGGNQVLLPLMTKDDTGTTGGHYKRSDALSLQEYDGISASLHQWVYLYESVVIYKPDIAKNSGRLGVLKLIDKKIRQAELAMAQRLTKALFTGTAANDQTVGLDSVIASSGSYGSIASTDLSTWVSNVDDNGGTNRALTQAIVDASYDNAFEPGVGGPDIGVMTKGVFSKFRGLLTGVQRTTRDSTLNGLGHKGQNLIYNGIDYLVDNAGMPANTLFHLDSKHFKLHVHRDHNMRRQSISDLETADALLERIFLYYVSAASERKFHSRVNDITSA